MIGDQPKFKIGNHVKILHDAKIRLTVKAMKKVSVRHNGSGPMEWEYDLEWQDASGQTRVGKFLEAGLSLWQEKENG